MQIVNKKVLNRDAIKFIAMFTMLLNHIAYINLVPLSPIMHDVFEYIGYFTTPVMCFFLVEGFYHTRSRKQYGIRLLLFALISQIPYGLVAGNDSMNMIFTLFCCFMILVTMEQSHNMAMRGIICTTLFIVTAYSDWGIVAPLLTVLLYQSNGDRKKMAWSYKITYVVFSLCNVADYAGRGTYTTVSALMHGAVSGFGILVAAFIILELYNGKRMERGRTASKWFFYIFYPAHLLILYLLKTFMLI